MVLLGAIEGGGTKFTCGIGTADGHMLESISFPTGSPRETLERAVQYFQKLNVEAIGIGTFGPIDLNPASASFGSMLSTPKPHWSGFNIVDYMSQHIDAPIAIDTDVNAAAIGEFTWGATKGFRNSLYITVGTGIGAGAIIEGQLLHGRNHPEMGHILIRRHVADHFVGSCPFHKDCLEGLASGSSIERRWSAKAYNLNESHPAWLLQTYYLAQALANYIVILSPERIVLGGGVMKQSHLFSSIRQQLQQLQNGYIPHLNQSDGLEEYIVPPGLGDGSGLHGALALAIKKWNQ